MKIDNWIAIIPMMTVIAFAQPAIAATALYATEASAQQSCGSDEVVWVDLDRGRFYHKGQDNFGKSNNGGYACLKPAKSQYREVH